MNPDRCLIMVEELGPIIENPMLGVQMDGERWWLRLCPCKKVVDDAGDVAARHSCERRGW
jgi:hypothetical protein